jgi:DNA-binding response OmpR family regulator
MPSSPLLGLRILLVEDDPIIALDVAQTLAGAGATVIGPAYRVAQAMDFIERSAIDLAILDFRLERETVSPVADRLSAQAIPYLFHTSSRSGPERAHPGVPIIDKPSRPEQLVAAIRALTNMR